MSVVRMTLDIKNNTRYVSFLQVKLQKSKVKVLICIPSVELLQHSTKKQAHLTFDFSQGG